MANKSDDIMERAASLVDEFHQYWLEHGEPHPSSNAYLALNRAFWFTKGVEFGIDMVTSKKKS